MKKTLDIILQITLKNQKVIDKLNNQLGTLTNRVKRASAANKKFKRNTDSLQQSFINFNRLIFSTTAFLNTFGGMFVRVFDIMQDGAKFDRLENQFKRTFGAPSGNILNTVSKFTDTFIDEVSFMKAALKLEQTGITKDFDKISSLISMAGVAAKRAGLDAGEGVQRFTKFLEDGALSHLGFLNVLAKTNPQLQAQLTLLKANGGQLGGVISTQAKLTLGSKALLSATKGLMFGNQDLQDVISELGTGFQLLKDSLGIFMGKALLPFLKIISIAVRSIANFFREFSENQPILSKVASGILLITGAALGLFTVAGTIALFTTAILSLNGAVSILIGKIFILKFALFTEILLALTVITSAVYLLNKAFKTMFGKDTGLGSAIKWLADQFTSIFASIVKISDKALSFVNKLNLKSILPDNLDINLQENQNRIAETRFIDDLNRDNIQQNQTPNIDLNGDEARSNQIKTAFIDAKPSEPKVVFINNNEGLTDQLNKQVRLTSETVDRLDKIINNTNNFAFTKPSGKGFFSS